MALQLAVGHESCLNMDKVDWNEELGEAMGMIDESQVRRAAPPARRRSKIGTRQEPPVAPVNPRELRSITTSIASGLIYEVDLGIWEGIWGSRAAAIEEGLRLLFAKHSKMELPTAGMKIRASS